MSLKPLFEYFADYDNVEDYNVVWNLFDSITSVLRVCMTDACWLKIERR